MESESMKPIYEALQFLYDRRDRLDRTIAELEQVEKEIHQEKHTHRARTAVPLPVNTPTSTSKKHLKRDALGRFLKTSPAPSQTEPKTEE